MPSENDSSPNVSFYTELRYPGTAEEIVSRYCQALRGLHKRLAADLRAGPRGEFAGTTGPMYPAIADAVDRTASHVDALEAVLLGAPDDEAHTGPLLRNIVANVVSDANFSATAEAHLAAPHAREGKFDQQKSAELLGLSTEFAEKFKGAVELFPDGDVVKNLIKAIKFISLILKDLGIIGKAAAEPSKNEVGEQLENKLDFIIPQLGALRDRQQEILDGLDDLQREIIREIITRSGPTFNLVDIVWGLVLKVRSEVDKIEQKADTLGKLLGQTLVSEPWIVDPTIVGHPNKTPNKGVKDELHDIEDTLQFILRLLGPVVTDGPKPPPPPPDIPYEEGISIDVREAVSVSVVTDARVKKIYVYAESAYAARTAQDVRLVRVLTPAFDLTGWLDLSNLRPGDVIETEVRISFANRQNILFARSRFDSPGLKAFSELAKGLNYISGSHVEISMRQAASADGYATPVELAYQFIVESQ